MSFYYGAARVVFGVAAMTLAAAPAVAEDFMIDGTVLFSALDGSPADEDGLANGILSLSGLTIDGGTLMIDVAEARVQVQYDVRVRRHGAIVPEGQPDSGPDLVIFAGGHIRLARRTAVTVDGQSRGGRVLLCAQGHIIVGGQARISANSHGIGGVGGSVLLQATGKIELKQSDGVVQANGDSGGHVYLLSCQSDEAVLIKRSQLQAIGAAAGGGTVEVIATRGAIHAVGEESRLLAYGLITPGRIALTAAQGIFIETGMTDPQADLLPSMPSAHSCDECALPTDDSECTAPDDCEDGNPCTDDACVDGTCVHVFNSLPCDDDVFCTAVDACIDGACVGVGDPCPDALCDEDAALCVECLDAELCEDGNPCTDDACVDGTCVYAFNSLPCDDDVFCTAVDTCIDGACVGSGDPCPGELCDEDAALCVECLDAELCDDGNSCTEAACVDGTCVYAFNSLPCDDGVFCTAVDTCIDGACVGSGDPCAGELCDEDAALCVECLDADLCDDGNPCTEAACEDGHCVQVFNSLPCDDDVFCTAVDTCIDGACVGSGDPCAGQTCDEAAAACVECQDDAACDDGDPCTADSCVGGGCTHEANVTTCDDGLFCTAVDTCVDGVCQGSGDPCPDALCDEGADRCVDCLDAGPCDDGNGCTADYCDGGMCVHLPEPDGMSCDDGDFCTAADVCSAGACGGSDTTCPGALCDPIGAACVECLDASDCDDVNDCTVDECSAGACLHTPLDESCDDGLFCTAADACVDGLCIGSGDRCPDGICDETQGRCVACLQDGNCADGNSCTADMCVGGVCLHAPLSGPCDDGLFCTSADACVLGECIGDEPTCTGLCNDVVDTCVPPPPAAPVLDAHATLTDQIFITLTGTATGASSVQASWPGGMVVSAVNGAAFSLDLAVVANRANDIVLTALSSGGTVSSPTVTVITHDATPPVVFIDAPTHGQTLNSTTSDVAGRVSDTLSGFMGLAVTVNGVTAIVEPGIGTNGTFLATGVPLNTSAPTTLTATATNVLGYIATTTVTVQQEELPTNQPRLIVVSGNAQSGVVHRWLPQPAIVQVLAADGTPFANKVVTFEVQRSDGRLETDTLGQGRLMHQVHTDTSGHAQAFWRLGGDAGCGNNRLQVTSRDIAGAALFCASAVPGPPVQLNVSAGHGQHAEVGSVAPQPLRVWVSDGCNGIGGVDVTFAVLIGSGQVNGLDSAIVQTSATGHAEVELTLGPQAGNNHASATFSGNPSAPAVFVVRGLQRTGGAPAFAGVVLDNASRPLGGVQATLEVNGLTVGQAATAVDGSFRFDDLPDVGAADLILDGAMTTTINGAPVPSGTTFPELHFESMIVPGALNNLPGPALMPALSTAAQQIYDGAQTDDLVLTCAGIDGLRMIVRAGTTVTLPDGTQVGPGHPGTVALSLSQVHHDDVPMPMPDGAAPPFAWTFQPGGAQFDHPVSIEYPNMSGLPAGSVSNFLSFNHDTGRFEIIGTGTVDADGATIRSDPGVGVLTSGWACNCPPYSVTGACEKEPEEASCPLLELPIPLSGSVAVGEDLELIYEVIPDDDGVGFDTVRMEVSSALGETVFTTVGLPGEPGLQGATWTQTRWNMEPGQGRFVNPANGPYLIEFIGRRGECTDSIIDAMNVRLILKADLRDTPPDDVTVSRSAGFSDIGGILQIVLVGGATEVVVPAPDLAVGPGPDQDVHLIVDSDTLQSIANGDYQVEFRNLRDAIGNFADADGDSSNGIQVISFPLSVR
jgi:hypothetical protein